MLVECNNPKCNGRIMREDGLIDYTKIMEEFEVINLDIGWGSFIPVKAYICRACGEVRFFKENKQND